MGCNQSTTAPVKNWGSSNQKTSDNTVKNESNTQNIEAINEHASHESDEVSEASGDIDVSRPRDFVGGLRHQPLFSSRIKTGNSFSTFYECTSQVLGSGISGTVRVGRHRASGRLVAVKTLNITNISRKRAMLLYNEVAVYLQLDHPHIVKLLDVFFEDISPSNTDTVRSDAQNTKSTCVEDTITTSTTPAIHNVSGGDSSNVIENQTNVVEDHSVVSFTSPVVDSNTSSGGVIRLIMELCTGKELYDRLARKKQYSENDAIRVTKQMLSAINYCHQHHICHRDLKLENWVYRDSGDDAPLKLIDFGFSKLFQPNSLMRAMHGTVYYVAPEVMDGQYNEKCDIWSIGVIVYMLLSGTPPFSGKSDHEILVKIRRAEFSTSGPRWEGISASAKAFVGSLLKRNPDDRPSASEALRDPWLSSENKAAGTIGVDVLKSMQRFAASSAIRRASLGIIAISMHSEELDELSLMFEELDTGNKGTIKIEDLVNLLVARLNIPEEEAIRIFRHIDQTGDEEINYSEFVAATLETKVELSHQMIREAFLRFDVENRGHISLEDLRHVLGDNFSGWNVEDILKQCDIKKNGVIEFDEFMEALKEGTGDKNNAIKLQHSRTMDNIVRGATITTGELNVCNFVDTVLSRTCSTVNIVAQDENTPEISRLLSHKLQNNNTVEAESN